MERTRTHDGGGSSRALRIVLKRRLQAMFFTLRPGAGLAHLLMTAFDPLRTLGTAAGVGPRCAS